MTSFKSIVVILFGIPDFEILKSQTFLSFVHQYFRVEDLLTPVTTYVWL
jgi:hypothetical protein